MDAYTAGQELCRLGHDCSSIEEYDQKVNELMEEMKAAGLEPFSERLRNGSRGFAVQFIALKA